MLEQYQYLNPIPIIDNDESENIHILLKITILLDELDKNVGSCGRCTSVLRIIRDTETTLFAVKLIICMLGE